jgi:zinc transport system ATP-binding protein
MSAAITLDNVRVSFGDVPALDGATAQIEEGSFVALIGPNGCGKTTLLSTIMGLLRPDSGVVKVFGENPERLAAGTLGYVPQVKTLQRSFPARAIELVATGLRPAWPWRLDADTKSRATDALRLCGVEHLAQRPVGKLSGGELQRVFVARSLARKPKLLLLDEPAAGMDLSAEAALYHLLMHYRREHLCTIVMITHDWEGARAHATHGLLLNRRVLAYGTAEEVIDERALLGVFGHRGHIAETH